MKKILSAVALLILSTVAAVAHAQYGGIWDQQSRNPSDYQRNDALVQGRVTEGLIEQVRQVNLQSGQGCRASGALVGGMVGGVIARNQPNSQLLLTTLGALGGTQVAEALCSDRAVELYIRLNDGSLYVVTQQVDLSQTFVKGMRIGLVNINGKSRVTAL